MFENHIKLAAVAFIIGISFPLLQLAINELSISVTGIIMCGSAALYLSLGSSLVVVRKELLAAIVTAVSLISMIYGAYYISGALMAIVASITPLVCFIIESRIGRNKIHLSNMVALGLGVVVTSLLLLTTTTSDVASVHLSGLFPVITYGLATSASRILRTRDSSVDSRRVLFMGVVMATLVFVSAMLFQGDPQHLTDAARENPLMVLIVIFLGVITTAVGLRVGDVVAQKEVPVFYIESFMSLKAFVATFFAAAQSVTSSNPANSPQMLMFFAIFLLGISTLFFKINKKGQVQ